MATNVVSPPRRAQATAWYLHRHHEGARLYVCGTQSLQNELRAAGFPVLLDVSADPGFPLDLSLPADLLKADLRVFSGENGEAELGDLLLRARVIRRPVILAGVETEEQAKRLRSGGVQGVQGFRYHKPMPAEDFAALLERKA